MSGHDTPTAREWSRAPSPSLPSARRYPFTGSALVRDVSVGVYAITGEWPETFRLLCGEANAEERRQGDEARRAFLAEEARGA